MIIELIKGRIKIKPMLVPEPSGNFYIQCQREPAYQHLVTRITIDKHVYLGDRTFFAIDATKDADVDIMVEMLDPNDNVVATYRGRIPVIRYLVYGAKPVRPDVEIYIRQLLNDREQMELSHKREVDALNARIQVLENTGEVI